jgi:hypothetical protein
MRDTRFAFLCDADDRELIAGLSRRLERSQGDAIRWVIRQAAVSLGVERERCDQQEDGYVATGAVR